MWILLGIALGIVYVIQPIDALHAPVEWMNSALVEYTSSLASWGLGFLGESEVAYFLTLIVAAAAPGIAGLAINLIAPLGRVLRVVFSIAIVLVSLGAFGTLEWQQALLFSTVTTIVGGVLAIASGGLMEAAAAFFSITLGVSQVRMLLTNDVSPHLQDLKAYIGSSLPALSGQALQYTAVGIALVPTILVVVWLLFRLSPTRSAI